MTSAPGYIVVVGNPSNRLPAPSPDLDEGEVEEVRMAAEERLAELASRGVGPAPTEFYNWSKGRFGNRFFITVGNSVRTDGQQRSALGP